MNYFDIAVEYRNKENKIYKIENLENCEDDLNSYKCLQLNNEEFNIPNIISILIRQCDLDTEIRKSIKCAPADEIKHKALQLEIIYKRYYINSSNSSEILRYVYQIETIPINLGMKKVYEMNLILSDLIVDKGIIYEDYTSSTFSKISNTLIDYSLDDSLLVELKFRLDKIQDIYIIRYNKLVDVLGNLGGFYIILEFLFTLIYICYREGQYKLYILNNYYDYHIEDDPIYNTKVDISVLKKGSSTTRSLRKFTDVVNRKATAQRLASLKINKLHLLNIWFYDLIRFNCRKQKHHEYVYRFINKTYLKEFDILNLIHRINRLDIFKSAILNKNQVYMLSHNKKRQIISEINQQPKEYEQVQFQKLTTYLHENKISNTLTELDNFMLKQVTENFKNEIFKIVELDEMETE